MSPPHSAHAPTAHILFSLHDPNASVTGSHNLRVMGEPRHELYFCALAPLAIGATVLHRLFGRPYRAHLFGQPVLTRPPPRAHKWVNSVG